LGVKTLPRGTEFLNAETGGQKSALRDRKGHRRLQEWDDTGENPHRNGLS
jgi:hypothetical protein